MLKQMGLLLIGIPAVLALLAGCSATRIVNALAPTDTYTRVEGVRFGAADLQLDIYRPTGTHGASPVVVFFYGGNWQSGSRSDYLFVGEALASRGITAVLADYRLYPAAKYPDFLADSAAAVRWASEHIAEFGGDPARLYLMGHSAGAYNAAMLALDQRWLAQAGFSGPAPRGWIGLAGPYDFLPLTDPALQAIFAPRDGWPATQPIHYVQAGVPPTLLLTADGDTTVYPRNSEHLAAALRASGNQVAWLRYTGTSHAGLIGALSYPLRHRRDVLDQISRFVQTGQLPADKTAD
ncbi:Carboxylesterase NlhH [Andreprevotia sp. IGB-42]|uniref:alpha/beta hydrolase n=1 Tax=Andreprevotia sp. IGB-42 TaxID=2497473 RepID=UPI00135746F3|nr:alpha/beta hydrolase [Andreprevotia sp. IGB-42]KAF0814856.1 Carboxylesterase NlhH [Andreprevotia sp. IGB-42]